MPRVPRPSGLVPRAMPKTAHATQKSTRMSTSIGPRYSGRLRWFSPNSETRPRSQRPGATAISPLPRASGSARSRTDSARNSTAGPKSGRGTLSMSLRGSIKSTTWILSRAAPGLDKCSPPESEDTYKDYKFFMMWYPVDNFEKATCLLPKETLCKDAYETLVRSNCGSNTGTPRNRLFVDAKLNVGCGQFGWHVESIKPPPPKPEVGKENCHDPTLKHEPVMENVQSYWSDWGCGEQKGKADFRADTKPFEWQPADASQFTGGLPVPVNHYRWKIEWIEGCSRFEQQSLWDPVGDGSLTCDTIMKEHVKCPDSTGNGSPGGYKDVRCLRYQFYTT